MKKEIEGVEGIEGTECIEGIEVPVEKIGRNRWNQNKGRKRERYLTRTKPRTRRSC
jgi:hypothetical protein